MDIKSEPAYIEREVLDLDVMTVTGGLQFTIRDGDQVEEDETRLKIVLKDISYMVYKAHLVYVSRRKRIERVQAEKPRLESTT